MKVKGNISKSLSFNPEQVQFNVDCPFNEYETMPNSMPLFSGPKAGLPNMGGMGGTIPHEEAVPPHQSLSPPIQKNLSPPPPMDN